MAHRRSACVGRRWCPEEDASFTSQLFFMYMNSLMRLGSTKHLEASDVWDVARRNVAASLSATYSAQMLKTADPNGHPCVRTSCTCVDHHGPEQRFLV
jgi:hypothetical protein